MADLGGMTGLGGGLTAANFIRFARVEATGKSPAYAVLAEAVAHDGAILDFLDGLPPVKRQPNLLFAAARFLLEGPVDRASLHELVAERASTVREVILSRSTQTNEPARCAVLLPALAAVPGPLALIEVGASAGLTLFPDVYSYDYAGHRVAGSDPTAPTLRCRPVGPVPLPIRVPTIVWRAGIDVHPLDVTRDEDKRWLECLVWPGQPERVERLGKAAAAVATRPWALRQGDLLEDLAQVASEAPPDATLVVYHSAVLAYVGEAKRKAFSRLVGDLGGIWLSNEGDGVLRCIGVRRHDPGVFLLVRNGIELLARSDPHGAWIEWLA